MTRFLVTDEKPDGFKLEEILTIIRNDIFKRMTKIMDDPRSEAKHVLDNNIAILGLLAEAINRAEDSTRVLNKTFGPHKPGTPRIGTE